MAVSFSKNQEEITKAWRQVTDSKGTQNWALFGYEGTTNDIKLESCGHGLKELAKQFVCHPTQILYALCRVVDEKLGVNKSVLINWQGESSPLSRRGLYASHIPDVVSYFKGCSQTITIRNDDEATEEYLMDQIVKSSSSRVNLISSINNDQPSSISTSSTHDEDDDDERVGRRSELIRLERNQETQSLISKGLIKNKRAIFEQAASQQQSQPPSVTNSNTTRRPSGTIVTQRLNAFKSLDVADSSCANVEKFTNGSASIRKISFPNKQEPTSERKDCTIEKATHNTTPATTDTITTTTDIKDTNTSNANNVSQANEDQMTTAKTDVHCDSTVNGSPKKDISETKNESVVDVESDFAENLASAQNGENYGIKARALYDYEAADTTEISFDPDDLIGFIEKVDSGWWHGTVVSGQYKGQCGLFPANYVEELK